MSSTTGLLFSYAIGLIFLVGGVVFLLFLDDNKLLFGIPYVVLGILLIGGVRASQRRRGRRPRPRRSRPRRRRRRGRRRTPTERRPACPARVRGSAARPRRRLSSSSCGQLVVLHARR